MKKQTNLFSRRLLQSQVNEDVHQATLSPDPIFQPVNVSSDPLRRHYNKPNSPMDSSMALTILVLLTAIFFMGFFSIYIRRFAQEDSAANRRRREPSSQPSSSEGNLRYNRKGKGLDSSTVQALPLVYYGEGAKQMITTNCLICLSEFEEKEIVKMIPHCKHVFHPNCLDTWLSSHVSCPLCRSTQLFKKVDDEVRLDVKEVQSSNGAPVTELQGESTAESGDTLSERTPVGVRRSCSCTNLEHHVVLLRSMSF